MRYETSEQCADRVAREFAARVIKKALKPDRKAAIQYAIRMNDYTNYPDSASDDSITTLEMNEIHFDISPPPKKKKINCFCFFKKIKYSYTITSSPP